MSKLPAEVEAEGLRAYEQARAFESVGGSRWPLIYGGIILGWIACAILELALGHLDLSAVCLGSSVVFGCLAWYHGGRLRKRHATNLHFLAELEKRYGPDLPWLEVERHLAALEHLQQELQKEKALGRP